MASEYILAADYAFYSLPASTQQAQVHAASAVVDGYLQRPAGAVYDSINKVMSSTGAPILETLYLPIGDYMMLSYAPVAQIIKVEERNNGAWQTITGTFDFDPNGKVYLDAPDINLGSGPLRVTYIAGWQYASLPAAIKQAVANIIVFATTASLPGNTKKVRAGDTEIERFDDTAMDGDTRAMLSPYKRIFA